MRTLAFWPEYVKARKITGNHDDAMAVMADILPHHVGWILALERVHAQTPHIHKYQRSSRRLSMERALLRAQGHIE